MKLKPSGEIQMIPIVHLKTWDRNPRTITAERFDALKKALSDSPEMMRARPTIALAGVDYAPDGTIIAGNMRYRAAAALFEEEDDGILAEFPDGKVPTFIVQMDESKAIQWALRDNNPYGDWQDEALAELIHDLNEISDDLDLTGFPTGSVQMILEGVGPKENGFKRLDDDLPAEYVCPGCGYEWSGNPKPGQEKPVAEKT